MPLSPLPLQLHTMHNFLPDASADALPASFLFSISFFAAFLAIYFATQHAQPDATHTQRHIRRHAHTDNEAHTHTYELCLCFLFVLQLCCCCCCFLFVISTWCSFNALYSAKRWSRERERGQERAFIFSLLLNLPLLSCSGFA